MDKLQSYQNNDVRTLYIDLIDKVNEYNNIPWEVRRITLEAVLSKVEKQADNSIKEEIGCDMRVDTLILGGENAEELQQD